MTYIAIVIQTANAAAAGALLAAATGNPADAYTFVPGFKRNKTSGWSAAGCSRRCRDAASWSRRPRETARSAGR